MLLTAVVFASVAVGLLFGAAFVVALVAALRRGRAAAEVATPTVPDGAAEVLDAIGTAFLVLTPANRVVRASPSAADLRVLDDDLLVAPDLVELAQTARRDHERARTETELTASSGTEHHFEATAAPLGTRYILILLDDRTEAKRLEEVRRDFVANLSHELKTPIASVGLLADAIVLAATEPERVVKFTRQLSAEATRLGRITHEVIELSRLQSDDRAERNDRIDIDDIVREAADQNRIVAGDRHIAIVTGAPSHGIVLGDRSALIVAVHNLIANAITYSPVGSHVGVRTFCNEDTIDIVVTDQGIGIPPEEIGRVFERFYRVDPARSRNTGGSGLGLSIVKHIVQNHRGTSAPGRGPDAVRHSALRCPARRPTWNRAQTPCHHSPSRMPQQVRCHPRRPP